MTCRQRSKRYQRNMGSLLTKRVSWTSKRKTHLAMNPFPRHILRKLLAEYGPTLLDEPERVDAFLADLCGEYRRERYLIVQAMRWRVPADLISQPQGAATIGPRLSRSNAFPVRAGARLN